MRLKLDNLSKRFSSLRRQVSAVDGIDLEVRDREFFVLLGPSGCGKSTLLNLIAGLDKPTGGEIWYGERLAAAPGKKIFLTPRERNVAMVFQSYALYPHLTVGENIAFPMRIAHTPDAEIQESVRRAAQSLEIENLLTARPGELSGGQRQRVAIARAIVRRPEIFLLDEPLSNLDAQLRNSTRARLKILQRNLGITTVYVTHDQHEAMTLGDRIAILRNGRIEQVGAPLDLYENPASAFVARFIGSPPMNLLPVNLEDVGGAVFATAMDVRMELPEALARKARGADSQPQLLGIRPEHVRVRPEQESKQELEPAVLRAKVETVEALGRENLLHLAGGKWTWSALTADRRFQEGDQVSVAFDLEKAHLYPASEPHSA